MFNPAGCFNLKVFVLLFLLTQTVLVSAQKKDTIKLFYAINEYQLSAENQVKLRALNNTLSNKDSVFVWGFTDYLAKKDYNIALSTRRAETIKAFLTGYQKDLNINTSGRGAIARSAGLSALGEPLNRRVDIIVVRQNRLIAGRIINPGRYKPDLPAAPPPIDYRAFTSKLNNLAKLDQGSSLSLEELTFQPGRHFLNPEAVGYLNRLMQYLKDHNDINFEIIGHICCDIEKRDGFDPDTRNNNLSLNRARYIFDYFLNSGIDRSRMSYTGVGSSKPRVWPELTDNDQYLNRRVEIVITGK